MMRTPIRVAVVAIAAAVLASPVASPVAPEVASATTGAPEPWQPYPEEPLTLPAARYCGDFDLVSTPVRQRVRSQVLERFDSGAVEVQRFRGRLIVRVTNQVTGESVRRNISGRALVTYREDGSLATYEMRGPIGFGWPQQDAYDRGFYVMDGYHLVAFDETGVRTMLVDRGTEENLCAVLA